ncbi:hypothetical protein SAMN04489844_0523 [Nocardioides exalbidus]|uniref:Bacterial Ig domain-containing protein n=1 Tax=Nocardioides exalbidus TaxID=402596 RepID=A0A1H4KBN6_9ACTN|nr:hypothetical protein [Nocardioides exalbidus]SEB55964.1 hypothetical protein SAMN04489844_0523 [Nocardioides exalbidus]
MSTTTRLVTGVTTAALIGVAPLVLTAPARAAEPETTYTVAEPSVTMLDYGDSFDVSVDLDSTTGFSPTGGTTTLQALRSGAASWTTVATSSSPGSDFYDVEPTMNTTYKVVYSGFSAASSSDDSFAPSESAEFQVGVRRLITHPSAGLVLKGKVTPGYGGKKVTVKASRSRTGPFKAYKKIRTNRAGKYRIKLPARDGVWYWQVSVRGDSRWRGNSYIWQTEVFHRS